MKTQIITCAIVGLFLGLLIPFSTPVAAFTEGSFSGATYWAGKYYIGGNGYVGPYLSNVTTNSDFTFRFVNIPWITIGGTVCQIGDFSQPAGWPKTSSTGTTDYWIRYYKATPCYGNSGLVDTIYVTFHMASTRHLDVFISATTSTETVKEYPVYFDVRVSNSVSPDTTNYAWLRPGLSTSDLDDYLLFNKETVANQDEPEGGYVELLEITDANEGSVTKYISMSCDNTDPTDGIKTKAYLNKCTDCSNQAASTQHTNGPWSYESDESVQNVQLHSVLYQINTDPTYTWNGSFSINAGF